MGLYAPDPALVVFEPSVVGDKGATCLAWQTTVASIDGIQVNEILLVDAHTGEIALHYPLVYTALNRMIYDVNNTSADPWNVSAI